MKNLLLVFALFLMIPVFMIMAEFDYIIYDMPLSKLMFLMFASLLGFAYLVIRFAQFLERVREERFNCRVDQLYIDAYTQSLTGRDADEYVENMIRKGE